MKGIGLMQGRLTPSRGRGIQFFLKDRAEWEQEFEVARKAGISSIEWVCDPQTPLFEEETQRAVREVVSRTGIAVRNMDLHETTTKQDIALLPDELFERICASIRAIDGGTVEVPLVESSSLLETEHYASRVAAVRRLFGVAERHGVPIALETDLPPDVFVQLLAEFPKASVVYDVGNSAGLGYDMLEELRAYGPRISNVHLKDKPFGKGTVPLGEGSVDFKRLFAELRRLHYTGEVTLQAARQEDGKEVETTSRYVEFIKNAHAHSF